jgi:sugar phosphate isomerase/epimerase
MKPAFGISTFLFHGQRLVRDHVREIASNGFTHVELFTTQTHFDCGNPASVADLQGWLAEAGLELHSVHAPVVESYSEGRWGAAISLAANDQDARMKAVGETEQALQVARRIPFRFFVLHLGLPRPAENSRDAARRSVEALQRAAEPLGVRLVVEVLPNELSRAASLVHFVEKVVDLRDVGICLDFGHAHMDGDIVDAIETVSEHLMTTHVHDNRGRSDDHLLPFEGTIDWPAALTAIQKVGYDGTLMFELPERGSSKDMLKKVRAVRERMEKMLSR